jgi:hypothetical protein
MKTIQFHAVVGADQIIRPPNGVRLPEGEIEVRVEALPAPAASQRPGPGLCRGMIAYMADDFDAPLADMKAHMS